EARLHSTTTIPVSILVLLRTGHHRAGSVGCYRPCNQEQAGGGAASTTSTSLSIGATAHAVPSLLRSGGFPATSHPAAHLVPLGQWPQRDLVGQRGVDILRKC